MNQECAFLITILADYLAARPTIPQVAVDWEKIEKASRIHQVEGIVYYQCKNFIPAEVCGTFELSFSATLYYYKNREKDYELLHRALIQENIPHFTIKGLEIAKCYPIPELRTMGDLDVIIKRENKELVNSILLGLGFCPKTKAPEYDWHYTHNGMLYELHHDLLYDEVVTLKEHEAFFNDCWNYVKNGKIDWSFHFLFLLEHLRKHLLNSGAGFRMFMDIAAVIKEDPGLDWKWIEKKLYDLNMEKFSKVCFTLIDLWFAVKTPLGSLQLDDSFYNQVTEKVFSNGVFGFQDEGNNRNNEINGILKYGAPRTVSRILVILKGIFPKYNNMRYISYYRFVDGKPWLLPAAWLYRMIRMISGKTAKPKEYIKKASISNDKIDVREEELRQWGLME